MTATEAGAGVAKFGPWKAEGYAVMGDWQASGVIAMVRAAPDAFAVAKVMAASADLLEAAQWARTALHDYPCEARDRLDAAIAKAGAQP